MSITVRAIEEDEYTPLLQLAMRAFGGDANEADVARFRGLLPGDRTSCAFEGRRMVGTCAAYDLTVALPGGALPMAGTTLVAVEQTHRRRGILRQMMRAHIDQAIERGDPLAGLWSSEGGIYGRFGYGPAATAQRIQANARTVRFRDAPTGAELELLRGDTVAGRLEKLYERCWRARPGMLARSADWWRLRVLADPPERREGASEKRHVLCVRDGVDEGFVTYRQKATEATFGHGTVEVLDLVADTPAAHGALWRYLLSIDLFPEVLCWNAPVDDPLEWCVEDAYTLRRTQTDNLWLRILDVGRALQARSYRVEAEVRIQVIDDFGGAAAGRFALEASTAGSRCTATAREPDVTLSAATLATLYLGRRRARAMADAGVLHGDSKAIAIVDALFAWDREPWCSEVF